MCGEFVTRPRIAAQSAVEETTCASGDDAVGNSSCHAVPVGVELRGDLMLAVNPEARVYASVERHTVYSAEVGKPLCIPVDVVNTGFVTAPVRVTRLAPLDGSVTHDWDETALSGAEHQTRVLELTSWVTGFVDVTLGFCLPGEPIDLGGRDRVNVLVRTR